MPVENDYPNLHDLTNTTMQSTKHELPPSQADGEISPTNPAKRRRVSAESATNEQKKSRGRPRVEPDDGGSAADVRTSGSIRVLLLANTRNSDAELRFAWHNARIARELKIRSQCSR
jgi:hypothetical protein